MSIEQNNGVCPAILVGLDELLKDGAPYQLFTQVGLLQSLFDPTNRQPNTIVQNVDAADGHPKAVRIKYKQRATSTDTQTSKDCAGGTPKPYFENVFTVNQYRQHTINVSEATVRTLCDAASKLVEVPGGKFNDFEGNAYNLKVMAEITMEIMMDLDAIRLAINSDLQNTLNLNYGLYTDGSAVKGYNMYHNASNTYQLPGAPVLDGYNLMKRDLARTTMTGRPIVVGEGLLDLAISSLDYGCCNSGGLDFGLMKNDPGFKYYKDYTVGNQVVGSADGFVMYMPGTMQFASYNEYVGDFARPIGIMQRGILPDPAIPGLVYDMRVIPNACSGSSVAESYDIFIEVHFDLWTAPTTMFKSGDRLSAVNGIMKAVATAI